jgi:hypothetical protein
VTDLTLRGTFSDEIGVMFTASGEVLFAELGSWRTRLRLDEWGPFNLEFDPVDTLGRFNIYVDSGSVAVPVPEAVWLLGSGLFVLAAGRRRCLRWMDSH